jgi:hypothetical protein
MLFVGEIVIVLALFPKMGLLLLSLPDCSFSDGDRCDCRGDDCWFILKLAKTQ